MILHVLAPGMVGGLESVVRLLATGQAARGDRVGAVLVLDAGAPEPPLAAVLRARGVAVWTLPVAPRAYADEWRGLRALFARIAPCVVQTHGYRADVLAGAVARRLGLPTVTTLHGFTGGDAKNRLFEWLQVRAARRAGATVVVSQPMAERLRRSGMPADRLHVIPNAYASAPPLGRTEARAALDLPAGDLVLGWVGRLGAEKGPDVFVRALAHLGDLPLHASFVGAGREEAGLRALAASLGIADRIRWHGLVPDAGRLVGAFDALVLSSRTEGTPIVLFEAMAAGTPIVATRVGGVPNVVADSEALLVPSEDPAALAAAIRALLADPAAARRRAEAARRRLGSEFAPAPWLERYAAVYDTLRGACAADPTRRTRS